MSYESPRGSKCVLITDANAHLHANAVPAGQSRGRQPRIWERQPYGSLPYATAAGLPARLSRDEIKRICKEREQSGNTMSARRRRAGLVSQDQNGTNYCWFNAVVSAFRLRRMKQNEPNVELSAASGAAVIKGGLNQGGWGGEALEFMVNRGIVSKKSWGNSNNDRNYRAYQTAAIETERKMYQILEWWELASRDFLMMMTLLCYDIPVPIGLNWWSHEVCAIDPLVLNAAVANEAHAFAKDNYKQYLKSGAWTQEQYEYAVELAASDLATRIWNSWSDGWSDMGEGDLSESKATPDDSVAPAVATPSYATAA